MNIDGKSNSSIKFSKPLRTFRVAMLSYSFYESDNRVRRYAETLAKLGCQVDVLSLRRPGQDKYGELKGVRVYRIQERVRDEKSKWDHLLRNIKFFIRSAAILTRKHIRRSYDLVHVHSVPDFAVFAAFIPKLTGAKIILDIHDIVPELYASKFHISRKSAAFRSLVIAEQASTFFADHVIISNDLWKETLLSRSVRSQKCTVILNYPDEQKFFKSYPKMENDKFIFLYPGTLNFHQGLDLAVLAFYQIKNNRIKSELHIIGEGPAKKQLQKMVIKMGLQERVIFKDPVSLDAIPRIMGSADAGIIPKRNDNFGGEAFSTKSLEFMLLGTPIIISKTKIDQYYFNDSIVKFFDPENVDDLARAMRNVMKDNDLRNSLVRNGLEFAAKNSWSKKMGLYLNLIESLFEKEIKQN